MRNMIKKLDDNAVFELEGVEVEDCLVVFGGAQNSQCNNTACEYHPPIATPVSNIGCTPSNILCVG